MKNKQLEATLDTATFLLYIIFAITLIKINYLALIGVSEAKFDKFYIDIIIIGLCAILFRIVTKKMW